MSKSLITIFVLAVVSQGIFSACGNGSDQLCRFCVGDNCALCNAAFVNATTGVCQRPGTEVDNCLSYSANGVCQSCRVGYYANSSGRCISIGIDNCAVVDPANPQTCVYCYNNVLVNTNGTCNNNVSNCQTSNCKFCGRTPNAAGNGTVETCGVCNDGYYSSFGNGVSTCVSESGSTRNCYLPSLATNGTVTGCSSCDYGYYLSNNTCLGSQNIPNSASVLAWMFSALLLALSI